jgi:hypothetical protein
MMGLYLKCIVILSNLPKKYKQLVSGNLLYLIIKQKQKKENEKVHRNRCCSDLSYSM